MDVLAWLLDSDPSIRWQVMRDLADAPAEAVSAERARVAAEGWGWRLLALQGVDGQWGRDALPSYAASTESASDAATRRLLRELHGVSLEQLAGFLDIDAATLAAWEDGEPDPDDPRVERYRSALAWMRDALGTYHPAWTSTTHTLVLLRLMGLHPDSAQARRAVTLVRHECRWDEGGQRYFDGEVEPCINGTTVALGAYFGENVDGIVERLLGEQLTDGGWNCEAERGSTRSSFHTTICVLEGLLEYERANGAPSQVTDARLRAQEYLLERRLFRRLSTGEVVNPDWRQFSFPPRWHYDVLRALDYLRSADAEPDERCEEAIELVASKRGKNGSWPLENTHPGRVHFEMEDGDGNASRWNTLRAMRVLDWCGRASAA